MAFRYQWCSLPNIPILHTSLIYFFICEQATSTTFTSLWFIDIWIICACASMDGGRLFFHIFLWWIFWRISKVDIPDLFMAYLRGLSYILLDNLWPNFSYEGVEIENNIFTRTPNEQISMDTLCFCNLQRFGRGHRFYMGAR